MAIPVAETTLLLILLCLRRFHQIDRAFKDGGWAAAGSLPTGHGTRAGKRVGVIGAGHTGRAVIAKLLALLGAEVVWLYDPYVERGRRDGGSGAQKSELEPLLRQCPKS